MANRYAVKLTRTIVETAIVHVEASNQRNAAYLAASAAPEWQQKSATVEVDAIEGADDGAPEAA